MKVHDKFRWRVAFHLIMNPQNRTTTIIRNRTDLTEQGVRTKFESYYTNKVFAFDSCEPIPESANVNLRSYKFK
jgi:hypothetical protein